MDPLSAFGLAASVVQFVAFTGALLKKTIEIHNSASGLPDALDVHDTYQELSRLSSALRDSTDIGHDSSTVDREIRKEVESVKELASACKSDCENLLGVIDKLRVQDGRGHRRKSLKAAFMAMRKDGEIKHLEERLAETERQITLYLCHISNYCHARHTKALDSLLKKADALALDQHARLSEFAASLEQIKTIVTTQFQQHRSGHPQLPRATDIEVVRELMAELALSERDMTTEQQVLNSLYYEHYLDRYQSITPAHKKTFSWVFNPANKSGEGKRLVQWLRHGQGVFWITGKPGSGKSTMMKFLCDDAQTITALQEWACHKPLAIVSHYFWLSGTMMQKSQEGLFRSLLYGIFQRCPDLIQKVCPGRWEEAGRTPDCKSRQSHWTIDELLSAISSIYVLPELRVKFCIFIDGLDEYRGDHVEMCNTIQKLGAASQDIKLCIASRPWNGFEQAFGGGQQLVEMHHLTSDDIRAYAQAGLAEHWAWTSMAANSSLANSLIELIMQHAQGVFLWVVLVIKEIREGLSNYDSLEDLYRRVEGFPSDLGEFFKLILESVDSFYHAKMSTALQICLAANSPLKVPIYYFHEQEHADPDYALKLPISQSTMGTAKERRKIMRKRLKGWCKGLLEVEVEEVQLLHRTVRDFLETPDMSAFLKSKAPVQFSANLSITKAYTAWMKSQTLHNKPENIKHVHITRLSDEPSQFESPFHWMTTRLLSAIHESQHEPDYFSSQTKIETFRHIDEFERSAIELENRGWMTFDANEYGRIEDESDEERPLRWMRKTSRKQRNREDKSTKDVKHAADLFRKHVLKHNMVLYLSHRISNDPGYLDIDDMNLYLEMFIRSQQPDEFYAGLRKSIERVLQFGQDPNKGTFPPHQYSSLFAKVMLGYNKASEDWNWQKQRNRMRLVSLLLEHGANPNASWNPCRIMTSIPLELERESYDGDTYILELDSLFGHGADSEAKMEDDVASDTISAREWFFERIESGLRENLNNEVIGQVSLRLIQRIEDKEEADAARLVLKRALPLEMYECMKSGAAGIKRKRQGDEQQLERRIKRSTMSDLYTNGELRG